MITPAEIRQQAFKKVLRGYDKEEVHAFLMALSNEWEKQLEVERNLKDELTQLQARYQTLKEVEDMLHKTLMQAEQSSRDTIENARQKAELRLREAESRAHEIVKRGIEDRNSLQKEIEEFSSRRDQILTQLRIFLKTQLDRLENFELVELPPARKNGTSSLSNGTNDSLFGASDNDNDNEGSLLDDIMDEL